MHKISSSNDTCCASCPNFIVQPYKPASLSKISTISSIAHRFINLIHGHKQELFNGLKLFAFLSIPSTITSTVTAIKDTFKSPTQSAIWLKLTSQLGSITLTICGLAQSLKSNNFVSARSVLWTSPVSLVGRILSLASIILNIHNIYQTKKVLKEMRKVVNLQTPPEQFSLEAYNKGMNSLFANRPLQFTARLLDTKIDVQGRLQAIQTAAQKALNSGIPEEQAKARKKLHDTFILVERRFTSNIRAGYINIISSLVSTVASTLLTTPLMPLGSGILLAHSVANLARSHFADKATAQFDAALAN